MNVIYTPIETIEYSLPNIQIANNVIKYLNQFVKKQIYYTMLLETKSSITVDGVFFKNEYIPTNTYEHNVRVQVSFSPSNINNVLDLFKNGYRQFLPQYLIPYGLVLLYKGKTTEIITISTN